MILVDSDVLIAHLRGVDAAREWLLRTRRDTGRLATSAVCVAEGIELATLNVEHFPMFAGLEPPFSLPA